MNAPLPRRAAGSIIALALVLLAISVTAAPPANASPAPPPQVGAPVDVAPWGERAVSPADHTAGIWWEDPREVQRVVVTFATDAPPISQAHLQWWQSQWPEHRIPRDQPAGAGESGWLEVGDHYRGKWRDADAAITGDTRTWTFVLRPLNAREFPQLKDFTAPYRTTLKLQLKFADAPPAIERWEVFTDSTWVSTPFALRWQSTDTPAPTVALRAEAFNSWLTDLHGGGNELRGTAWFASSPNVNSFDRSVATVRRGTGAFSFDPALLRERGQIFSPSLGALVLAQSTLPSGAWEKAVAAQQASAERPLYERVFIEPEQSLARALAEQPPKKGRMYMPLGTEGGRQRFGVNPDGSVFCVNDRINQPRGKDSGRLHWGGNRLQYSFGLPAGAPARRWLEDESLPIIHTQWTQDGIEYTQTAFVTRLDAGGLGFPDMHADDTAVLLVKIAGRNTATEYRPAAVALRLDADGNSLPLGYREQLLFAKSGDGERLRAAIDVQTSALTAQTNSHVRFTGNLPPSTDGFMLVKIPFITLDQPGEIERLRELDFDTEFKRVKKFWQSRTAASTTITTPVPELNHCHRAHVSPLLLNCGREVGRDRLMARVGGFAYGVYGNESCMMITDLDRRGFHAEAGRCLETFLEYQGTVALPGNYQSQAGVFNGANGWEQGGYNQHHGWILWAMAEHYWLSGDRAWLQRNADKLLLACQWITRERARTRELDGLRRIERGLLPPGSLEDIGDWRCWMSNNGFSWWGLDAVARALTDINHPRAAALRAEADAYRQDILNAFGEASRRAPLVSLRDGTWIPQIPAEAHRRGRAFGWITVTLEGPIYFLRTGLLGPNDALAVPILQDYEDNLYLSDRYGYSWERHGAQWFSRGGISMQPNLLCSPHPYLLRDEVKHFLRAYFNGFASCYYPETQTMCEHPLPDLGDWRGDHFKSSDEANSNYWQRLMFVEDDRGDDVLRLGMALPRAWFADGEGASIERAATHFGPMNLRFESKVASGAITAKLDPPTRRAPKQMLLRFRHPEAKSIQRVEINGQAWTKFDAKREWVELPAGDQPLNVAAFY